MTKKGYTHIIVPKDLHQQLKAFAEQNGLSINQFITYLMNTNIDAGINTGINTPTPLTPKENTPFQTPILKSNLNLSGAGGIRTPVWRARVSKPRPS